MRPLDPVVDIDLLLDAGGEVKIEIVIQIVLLLTEPTKPRVANQDNAFWITRFVRALDAVGIDSTTRGTLDVTEDGKTVLSRWTFRWRDGWRQHL